MEKQGVTADKPKPKPKPETPQHDNFNEKLNIWGNEIFGQPELLLKKARIAPRCCPQGSHKVKEIVEATR
jgi:hypothetical protein